MKEMIFWGATGQAKVLRECLHASPLKLIAVFDNNPAVTSPFADVPLHFQQHGFQAWKAGRVSAEPVGFLVAVGGDKGKMRLEMQEYLESEGLVALTAQHPTAFVADNASVGVGSQILAHAMVCVEVRIGRSCIINTGASVDHECHLDDGVHICPGARLAGCIEVGRFAMIGTGAVVLPRLKIGEGALVGAGAVVTKDVAAYTVVAGNPARVLRRVTPD